MSVILSAQHARVERIELSGYANLPGLHAWRVDNRVGESPLWCSSTQTLLWIDVRAPAVLRLDPATSIVTRWTLPEVVGAMGLCDRGVVLAMQRSLATLDLDTGCFTTLQTLSDEPAGNRLNDGTVSRSGRWFVFGSMDDSPSNKQATGSLFVTDRRGPARRLVTGLTVANGTAFSPDGATLYYSDSHAGRVWHAPWDEAAGTMGVAAPLCSPDESAGRPDGATVDANGDYWSAGVSAGCLNRFGPSGALVSCLALPCRAPTMPCLGGSDGRQLFLTSLVRPGWALGPEAVDGALICAPAPEQAVGLPSARWR
jgi:sugar lactone lactonase YvrE